MWQKDTRLTDLTPNSFSSCVFTPSPPKWQPHCPFLSRESSHLHSQLPAFPPASLRGAPAVIPLPMQRSPLPPSWAARPCVSAEPPLSGGEPGPWSCWPLLSPVAPAPLLRYSVTQSTHQHASAFPIKEENDHNSTFPHPSCLIPWLSFTAEFLKKEVPDICSLPFLFLLSHDPNSSRLSLPPFPGQGHQWPPSFKLQFISHPAPAGSHAAPMISLPPRNTSCLCLSGHTSLDFSPRYSNHTSYRIMLFMWNEHYRGSLQKFCPSLFSLCKAPFPDITTCFPARASVLTHKSPVQGGSSWPPHIKSHLFPLLPLPPFWF